MHRGDPSLPLRADARAKRPGWPAHTEAETNRTLPESYRDRVAGTGSGKSTLVAAAGGLAGDDVATICHDHYHKAHPN